jgi:hypothetical protein
MNPNHFISPEERQLVDEIVVPNLQVKNIPLPDNYYLITPVQTSTIKVPDARMFVAKAHIYKVVAVNNGDLTEESPYFYKKGEQILISNSSKLSTTPILLHNEKGEQAWYLFGMTSTALCRVKGYQSLVKNADSKRIK